MSIIHTERPKTGDPSGVHQTFPPFSIHLLCCHYWNLFAWKHFNLSFPYWRIYWNPAEGASLTFKNLRVNMQPHMLYLIPPNTEYSANYDPSALAQDHDEFCMGGPILKKTKIDSTKSPINNLRHADSSDQKPKESLEHLFIHFNLGLPFDRIEPQLIQIPLHSHLEWGLKQCVSIAQSQQTFHTPHAGLSIIAFVTQLLQYLPHQVWDGLTRDYRVEKIIHYIQDHLNENLDNASLAQKASMATNSFARLFLQEMGQPLGKYILEHRIHQACRILHHSSTDIDQIADTCGFCDRHHFSRMFKKTMGISPGQYRKTGRSSSI